MARRGRTPERGGEDYAWTFDHCRDPKERTGYTAGPLHWLLCHDCRPTKPCFLPLYGPNANCPYCRATIPKYEFGYQPLRDLRGRPWVVGIRETYERVVSRIGGGQGVRWGRAPGKCEACYVEPHPVSPDWNYWYPDLKATADLSGWLCRLWELPTLLPAVTAYFAASDKPVSPRPAIADEEPAHPPEVDPELARCAREQRAALRPGLEAGGAFGEALGKLKPDRNGTH